MVHESNGHTSLEWRSARKREPHCAMSSLSDVEFSQFKWACHIERLRDLASGGDSYPVTVELDVVDFCNHHCGWCVDPRHGNTIMPSRMAADICAELSLLGVSGLVLKGGGEPMMHPE